MPPENRYKIKKKKRFIFLLGGMMGVVIPVPSIIHFFPILKPDEFLREQEDCISMRIAWDQSFSDQCFAGEESNQRMIVVVQEGRINIKICAMFQPRIPHPHFLVLNFTAVNLVLKANMSLREKILQLKKHTEPLTLSWLKCNPLESFQTKLFFALCILCCVLGHSHRLENGLH